MTHTNIMFRGAKQTTREFRSHASAQPIFNADGDLNASSKEDAFRQIARLAEAVANGQAMNNFEESAASEPESTKKQRMAEFASAYEDSDRTRYAEVGAMIAGTLSESINREGYFRRILLKGEVQQGSTVRHRIKRKTVSALVASGPSSIRPEMTRGHYIDTPEFYVEAAIGVSALELAQGSSDLLDEKYFEAYEQIMVQEDRLFIQMAREQAGSPNDISYNTGGYTPATLMGIRHNIIDYGIDVPMILAASNVMTDFIASPTFIAAFDPITTHENITTGRIARLYGTDIVTDQFRDPRLKVVNPGEVFAFGPAEFVGGWTDRGPVQAVARDDMVLNGAPSKGWNFFEMLSMTVHTGRGISQGRR